MADGQDNAALPSSEQYGQISEDVISYSNLGLALAMAKETGITRVLCDADTPLTSSGVAQRAGLKERYVREVLNTLVTSRLVQLAPGTGGRDGEEPQYIVHVQYKDMFTKTAATSLMLSYSARLFDQIKNCFQPEAPSGVRYCSDFFDKLSEMKMDDPDVLLPPVLQTPGLQQRLESGIEAAEVGCGDGQLSLRLAAMFPNSRFTLTDVAAKPLEGVKKTADDKKLHNVTADIIDANNPPAAWNGRFDWVLANDVIHDLPHPKTAIENIYRSLRPGGHFSMVDYFTSSYVAENIGNMEATMMYAAGIFFCIPESYQQPDSEALGPCWGAQRARAMLEEAGFKILGIEMVDGSKFRGLCMCQKPE